MTRTADIREAENRGRYAERKACANAVREIMWRLERDGRAHPSRDHLKEAVAAIEARSTDHEGA